MFLWRTFHDFISHFKINIFIFFKILIDQILLILFIMLKGLVWKKVFWIFSNECITSYAGKFL